MAKSKLTVILGERLKIHNNWELLKQYGSPGKDIAVEFQAPAPGRIGWTDFWGTKVWSPFPTKSLQRAERHYSATWERDFSGPRKTSLPQALAWVTQNLGLNLIPSPFGGYIPEKLLMAARIALAKLEEVKQP